MKGFKKSRKPRGIKQDGTRSSDLCRGCYSLGCDPMAMSSKFQKMVSDRLSAGQCVGCGHIKCTCKSSLDIKPQ